MGMHIKSKNKELSISYINFGNIRLKLVEMIDADFFKLYYKMLTTPYDDGVLGRLVYRFCDFERKYNKNYLYDFLLKLDTKDKMSAYECKKILSIIDNIKDKIESYRFNEFCEILKDGAKNSGIKWS